MPNVVISNAMNNNVNINARSSVYSKKYGHNETDAIGRALAGRGKKSKIYNSSPKQFK